MKAEKPLEKAPKKANKKKPVKKYSKAYYVFQSNIGLGEILDMKAVLK